MLLDKDIHSTLLFDLVEDTRVHELVPVQQDLLNEYILHRVGLKVVSYVIHYLVVVKV